MENRQRIANRAHELFMHNGIKSITMDSIASDLKISKKTLYQNFQNKSELVNSLVENEIKRHSNCCLALKLRSENAVYELFNFLVYTKELYTRLNAGIIAELQNHYYNAYTKFDNYGSNAICNNLNRILREGKERSLYNNDINIDHFVILILETVKTCGSPVITKLNFSEKELFSCIISGLSTPDGINIVSRYKNEHQLMSMNHLDSMPYWEA